MFRDPFPEAIPTGCRGLIKPACSHSDWVLLSCSALQLAKAGRRTQTRSMHPYNLPMCINEPVTLDLMQVEHGGGCSVVM